VTALAVHKTISRPREPISQREVDLVVKRNDLYQAGKPGGQRAVLSYRDLTGLDLAGRNLADADLTAAYLCDANLTGANLNNAILFGCNLARANLRGASLMRADLRGASLREADLTGANLFDADLRDGHLAHKTRKGEIEYIAVDGNATELVGATLVNANLTQARLSGSVAAHTDFTDAMMRNCKLVRADLHNATLNGANLEGADLSGANLRGASLRNAVMVRTLLVDVDTKDADMVGVLTLNEAGRPPEAPVIDMLRRHEAFIASDGAEGAPVDVSGYDLRKAGALAGRRLSTLMATRAVLYGMNLEGIGLQAAQLEGADLRACRISNADLRGINLTGAKLNHTEFRDCNFGPLIIAGGRSIPSTLDRADARNADFRGANLHQARFRGTNLSRANLIGAQLEGADFNGANLLCVIKNP